jgi:hypothetical protein
MDIVQVSSHYAISVSPEEPNQTIYSQDWFLRLRTGVSEEFAPSFRTSALSVGIASTSIFGELGVRSPVDAIVRLGRRFVLRESKYRPRKRLSVSTDAALHDKKVYPP